MDTNTLYVLIGLLYSKHLSKIICSFEILNNLLKTNDMFFLMLKHFNTSDGRVFRNKSVIGINVYFA